MWWGWFAARNRGSKPLIILALDVTEKDSTTQILGTRIYVPEEQPARKGIIDGICEPFPPNSVISHPLSGYTLNPSQRVGFVIGMRALNDVPSSIERIRVTYSLDSQVFSQDFPFNVEVRPRVTVKKTCTPQPRTYPSPS